MEIIRLKSPQSFKTAPTNLTKIVKGWLLYRDSFKFCLTKTFSKLHFSSGISDSSRQQLLGRRRKRKISLFIRFEIISTKHLVVFIFLLLFCPSPAAPLLVSGRHSKDSLFQALDQVSMAPVVPKVIHAEFSHLTSV